MSQAQVSTRYHPFVPTFAPETSSTPLSTIVYRSRAVAPFSDAALQALATGAQAHNRREGITGLMVYDGGCFFQWLEGPPDGIARVMESIRNDPRHGNIEIFTEKSIPERVFAGWDMKLATRGAQSGPWRRDVIYPRLQTLAGLHRDGNAVPGLLAAMGPHAPEAAATSGTAALLKDIIHTAVIPELLGRRGNLPAPRPAVILDPRVLELAELLLASDASAALDLIHEQLGGGSPLPLYATLLEPAARRLGDFRIDDICSELDVTIGLAHLQRAVRLLGAETLPPLRGGAGGAPPAVLVVPQPGEQHLLGAALDSEAMWSQGWSPQNEFPTDDEALQKILTGSWFDVLDLTLSVALPRVQLLPRMARTIELARRASRNPALVVLVGGRIFSERESAADDVQADAGSRTAATIARDVLRTLPEPERRRATG